MSWIAYGVRGGILSTRYPLKPDAMPTTYRGAVVTRAASLPDQQKAERICLSDAIAVGGDAARIDGLRCFQCGECTRRLPEAFAMSNRFDLAEVPGEPERVRAALRARTRRWGRSVHLRHVDAGSDGSEEQELQAIFNPFYDANRLGIFLTATPRHADVLVVSGVVAKPMVEALLRAYEAMPAPKVVVALGTSACSGSIFSRSDAVVGPVSAVLPVDVFVPGAPPAPLTILHGLWVALGQAKAKGGAS